MGRLSRESLIAGAPSWRSLLLSSLLLAGAAVAQESAAPAAAEAAPAAAAPAAAAPVAAPAPMANAAPAVAWPEPVASTAEMMPLVTQSLLLDLAESGNRAIAVGERGAIILSEDRVNWRQVAEVPTRATLTALSAVGSKVWAVGRDGVILASDDAGEHWKVQRRDPWLPPTEASAGDDARHGAPLLDVLFVDENHGFAVGAYSLFLETSDGGATWKERHILADAATAAPAAAAAGGGDKWTFSKEELKIEDESEPHFNAIARTGDGSLLIAGERGSLLRSRDSGANWQRMKLPYDGSMFGAIGFEGQRAVVFGLRGHAFETDNLGDSWRELKTDTELSLLGGVRLSGGGLALVGANGLVLVRRAANEPLRAGAIDPAGALAAVLPIEGGAAFLVAGENGVARYQPR